MQAKGFIKFIIISLLVFAIYQLGFTLLDRHYKNAATEYALGKASAYTGNEANIVAKQQRLYYLDSIKNEKVIDFGPLELTYDDINKQALKLGLDLKGGISLLVEIDNADILRKLSHDSDDAAFNKALELTTQEASKNQMGFIEAFEKNYNQVSNGGSLAAIFAPYEEFKGKIDWKDSNADVIKAIKTEVKSKWAETYNVLSTRIDQFGVSNPLVTTPDDKGRIYVELPGAEDSERIRAIIKTSALLEFYKVYELREVEGALGQINDALRTKLGLDEKNTSVETPLASDSSVVKTDSTSLTTTDTTSSLGELGDLTGGTATSTDADTSVKKANPLYEVFQPNIRQGTDGQYVFNEGPVIGYASGRDRAKIDSYFAMEEVQSLLPKDLRFVWSAKPVTAQDGTVSDTYMLYALKSEASGAAYLNGDVIVDAYNSKDQLGQDIVGMSMNSLGAKKWADLTRECNPTGDKNSGKSIAIVLDNKVFSAPRSNGEITGGSSQITGMDNLAEASDLANILKSGKLDAKINIPQEALIGASLGQSAITSGLLSLAGGLLLVILFMVVYYSGAGLIANIALLVNMVLIMGALTSIRASLTLPGMAGIVLTIGMAVDANVIIFERIREELRLGKALKMAIADGFKHSYSSIIDSNVTTLIAGISLYVFGAGSVKGFAIVLIIGIVASFISAVFLSRLIFDGLSERNKSVQFGTNWSNNFMTKTNFDFLGKRKIAYAISSIVIIAGIVSFFTSGFELGVDFKGGRSYVVEFDQAVSTEDIKSAFYKEFGEQATVKKYDTDNKAQIVTSYLIEDDNAATDSIIVEKLHTGLTSFYKNVPDSKTFRETNILQANKVSTSIADDIKISAAEAGTLGAIFIFLYILVRFRKWQYGVGAIVSVIHDVLVLLAIFSIFKNIMPFSLEIEQKFIAAILTVIGYSINDTVIVFDRIREYLVEHPSKDFKRNVNDAINGTLSRTTITSMTTLLVVIVLFLFGGESIKGFSFALLIGIGVGTYSSIFMASAILVDTWKVQNKITTKKD